MGIPSSDDEQIMLDGVGAKPETVAGDPNNGAPPGKTKKSKLLSQVNNVERKKIKVTQNAAGLFWPEIPINIPCHKTFCKLCTRTFIRF